MQLQQLGSNQTLLTVEGSQYFFSYETLVAGYDAAEGTYWFVSEKYSTTTTRHINAYLGDNKPYALGVSKDVARAAQASL